MDYRRKVNKRAQINSNMSQQATGQNTVQQRGISQAVAQNPFRHNGIRQYNNTSPKHGPMNTSKVPTFESGECTACRKPSICVCERCGDFYCSPACQKKDWQSHRFICFPMPKLVQPTSTVSADSIYPTKTPLLTVNQISHANPLNNMQQQPQNSRNASQQIHSLNTHPSNSHSNVPQEPTNSKAIQNSNNQEPKRKESTATVPTVDTPKTNSHVTLTGFRSSNRCYVRLINPAVDDDYMLNARKIDIYGKSAKPLSTMPKLHSYAIALYNGVMNRVEIMLIRSPANIRGLLIDRGTIVTLNLRDLREISDEIISLKQYTCLIQLRNVSNYVLNEKLAKHLATYEHLDFKIKYDRLENGVELLHWQTEKSVNDEIEQFCKTSSAEHWNNSSRTKQITGNQNANVNNTKQQNQNSIGDNKTMDVPHDAQFYALEPSSSTVNSQISVQQKQLAPKENNERKEEKEEKKNVNVVEVVEVVEVEQPTMVAPFEIHYFKVGCAPFKAVVLDISCLEIGYVGCIAQEDVTCLHTVHMQLESINLSDKPYKPQLEEYCIAKYEDMWYRAQVIDIPDESHYTLMYIDFTNEATLTSADIRHFPAGVTGVCKTNLCLIAGLPTNLSAELIRFLNEEIKLQTVITIDRVKNIDEQVVVVECNSLLDKIRKNNLIN